MVKKSSLEERQEKFQRRLEEFALETRKNSTELRAELRKLMEKLELRLLKTRRRRRGRLREESSETLEPVAVHITVWKSEEVEEGLEKNLGDRKLQFTDVAKPEEDTLVDLRSFTAPVFDTYPDEEETKSSCNTDAHIFSLATSETIESEKEKYSGDDEPKWDSDDEEPSSEELTREFTCGELLPEKGHTATWVGRFCTLSELFLYLAREERDLDVGKVKSRPERTLSEADREINEEEPPSAEPPPEKGSPPSLMAPEEGAKQIACDEGVEIISQLMNGCVERENETEACVGWSYNELDLKLDSLGQAQHLILTPTKYLVSNSDLFNIERRLFTVKTEKRRELFGLGWFQKKVDFTSNPLGQTHSFIFTPPIFTNTGTKLQVEKEMDEKKLMGFDEAQNPDLSINFKVIESVFGFVGAPKIEVENMKILFPTNIEYKGTNILARCEVKEVGVNILIIVESSFVCEWDPGGFKQGGRNPSGLKQTMSMHKSATFALEYHGNQTHHKQWDPGELYSASCIIGNIFIVGKWQQHKVNGFTKFLVLQQLCNRAHYFQKLTLCTILEIHKFEALYGVDERRMSQYHQVLFLNFQQVISFIGYYGDASISSKKPKNLVIMAVQFDNKDAFGVCLVEVAISLLHFRWEGCLENYLVSSDMYAFVTKAKEPLLTVGSNLIFNHIFIITTYDDLVVLPKDKEMQVQVYCVGSYVDGYDFLATTWIEIGKKYEQESIREYEFVAAAVRCWHLSILIRQWDPGQLTYPMTVTAYGYHWNIFFEFLHSLSSLFERGSLSVACIAWSSCLKLWDPGGIPLSLLFYHLEDKVNFKGGSIDENVAVTKNKFSKGRVYMRRGRRVIDPIAK